MNMKSQINIIDLPLKILDLLFEYCEDMSNKVQLAQTHSILVQAFAYHCRNMFECVTSDTNISLSSWRFILPVCGSNIKKIHRIIQKNSDDDVEFVNLIALHCSSLEEVKFNFDTVGVPCVLSLIHQRQSSLRAIDLILFYGEFEMNPDMLKEFPELPLLESLNIYNIPVDNYYHIQKFNNLVELKIECWDPDIPFVYRISVPYIDILVLCAPLKKLQTLTLANVYIYASEQSDVHLPVILPLEKLSITNCCILVKEFPVCFNLKIVNIDDYKEYTNRESVERFILSQGKSLESLSYIRQDFLCNNKQFLEIIRVCRKLRYLHLQLLEIHFDLDFVKQIVDILQENGATSKNPLVLVAGKRCRSCKPLLHWLKFTSNPELIKVESSFGKSLM